MLVTRLKSIIVAIEKKKRCSQNTAIEGNEMYILYLF